MKNVPRVALGFKLTTAWGRRVMQGVIAYAERHGPWDCELPLTDSLTTDTLRQLGDVDGLIVQSDLANLVAPALSGKMPVVRVGMPLPDAEPKFQPHLHESPDEIAKMAIEHFRERGFRNFAYYAFRGYYLARIYGNAFVSQLQSRGFECAWFKKEASEDIQSETINSVNMNEWIRKLPKPVAILASWDGAAREVTMACRKMNIAVPEQVAVMGIGNDKYQNLLCSPYISSLDPGLERLGYESAKMLDHMLRKQLAPGSAEGSREPAGGKRGVKASPKLVPPIGVVTRQSTDVIAVSDERVVEAVRKIHEHLTAGVNVKLLVRELGIGRRSLEMAFKKHLGRTIHDEIARTQIERACRLLEDGECSTVEITQRCGFQQVSHFRTFFKKHTKSTPLEYRIRNQRQHYQGIP
ncbi:MAG: substrate-binding domain-containing protein [Phycisphaerales bacterium]|nr:substrate-binding domain-containing protein [Phycisphaerales bacterium]